MRRNFLNNLALGSAMLLSLVSNVAPAKDGDADQKSLQIVSVDFDLESQLASVTYKRGPVNAQGHIPASETTTVRAEDTGNLLLCAARKYLMARYRVGEHRPESMTELDRKILRQALIGLARSGEKPQVTAAVHALERSGSGAAASALSTFIVELGDELREREADLRESRFSSNAQLRKDEISSQLDSQSKINALLDSRNDLSEEEAVSLKTGLRRAKSLADQLSRVDQEMARELKEVEDLEKRLAATRAALAREESKSVRSKFEQDRVEYYREQLKQELKDYQTKVQPLMRESSDTAKLNLLAPCNVALEAGRQRSQLYLGSDEDQQILAQKIEQALAASLHSPNVRRIGSSRGRSEHAGE